MTFLTTNPGHAFAQCSKLPFDFTVTGCTVTFFSTDPNPPSPINWNFGDGATGTGNPITHVYLSNGTYTVTASYSGFGGTYTCTKTVTVTGCQMECCCAAFSGSVTRDCGQLTLSLSSECSNGTHSWSVATVPAGECITLVGFNSTMASQTVQVTNINTCTVTRLVITHTVDCTGGPYTVTQSVNINEDAIFIGRTGVTTNLQDYNCVLPGASYSGACPVFVTGIVNADKNFTFSGTDIQMHPGMTGFDVPAGKTLEFTQNTHIHGVGGAGCDCLWRGIYVNSSGTLRFDGINSTFNATIEDALYAVRVYQNSNLFLKKVLLNNNFVGVRATDNDFTLLANEQNEFDGSGPLKNICSLAGLNDLSTARFTSSGVIIWPLSYSNDRGYAGWFVNDLTALSLPALPFYRQNEFRYLIKGMEIYDTDFSMRENSTFLEISPSTGYPDDLIGTGGIFFNDADADGSNTFSFIGNGSTNALPLNDFGNCTVGIHIGTSSLGTRLNITNSTIINAQVGIHIDQAFGTIIGADNGNSGNPFKGIVNNRIRINMVQTLTSYDAAGIFLRDWNDNVSDLDITRNSIKVDDDQTYSGASGSSGIMATGKASTISPPTIQLEVSSNRIELNEGRVGIGLVHYPGAFVHDNGPTGSNTSGGSSGIFVNWNATGGTSNTRGIFVSGVRSTDELIGCNEVISIASGVNNMLVKVSPDNVFVRNHLKGPTTGVEFSGNCGTTTNFRCNTMEDNIGNGLFYSALAQTGNQGNPYLPGPPPKPASTNGNLWIGTFIAGGTAVADVSSSYLSSQFYVRPIAGENPLPNVNPITGWFQPTVPAVNIPDCQYECPMSDVQAPPSKRLSSLDLQIATDSVQYEYYPEAYKWWNERNLYKKLYLNPALTANQPELAAFMSAKQESSLAQLIRLAAKADSLSLPSLVQKIAFEQNWQDISGLFSELALVDSLLMDSLSQLQPQTLSNLEAERDTLLARINVLQAENGALNEALDATKINGVPSLMDMLSGIEPGNIYELNEKKVLYIFLHTIMLETRPDSSELQELLTIGNQCIYEGGPAVDDARHMYTGFTGVELPEVECERLAEREGHSQQDFSGQAGFVVYPNPADDYLIVQISATAFMEAHNYQLIISNSLGQPTLQAQVNTRESRLSIGKLPVGAYHIRLENAGKVVFAQPLVINR